MTATRLLTIVALCQWTLAVVVTGTDMLGVWNSEMQGAGNSVGVQVGFWERLGLLAIVALCPPCLFWALWRFGAWMMEPGTGANFLTHR